MSDQGGRETLKAQQGREGGGEVGLGGWGSIGTSYLLGWAEQVIVSTSTYH